MAKTARPGQYRTGASLVESPPQQPIPPPITTPSQPEAAFQNIDSTLAFSHYRGGSGRPLRMSFNDIDTSSVKPSQFPALKAYIGPGKVCRNQIIQIEDARLKFLTSGDQSLFLGNITLKLNGVLITRDDCSFEFKGILKAFDDIYDFNPSFHRNIFAEGLTRLGSLIPGTQYYIQIRGEKPISEKGISPAGEAR